MKEDSHHHKIVYCDKTTFQKNSVYWPFSRLLFMLDVWNIFKAMTSIRIFLPLIEASILNSTQGLPISLVLDMNYEDSSKQYWQCNIIEGRLVLGVCASGYVCLLNSRFIHNVSCHLSIIWLAIFYMQHVMCSIYQCIYSIFMN